MSLSSISIVGNVVKPPAQTIFNSGTTRTTIIVAVDTFTRDRSNRSGSAAANGGSNGRSSGGANGSTGDPIATTSADSNNGRDPNGATSTSTGWNRITDFYRVEVWGQMGERAYRYITKGNQVTAIGRLSFDKWIDREGRDRVTPVIHANQISIPPRPRSAEQQELQRQSQGDPTPESATDLILTEEDEDAAAAALFGASA